MMKALEFPPGCTREHGRALFAQWLDDIQAERDQHLRATMRLGQEVYNWDPIEIAEVLEWYHTEWATGRDVALQRFDQIVDRLELPRRCCSCRQARKTRGSAAQ